MANPAIISIVDDDESVRMALDGLLRSNGYTVQVFASAEAFLASTGPWTTACLISDIQMPGLSGTQLHETLLGMGLHIPVIFISGHLHAFSKIQTSAPTAVAFFPKPFPCNELIACIETVLDRPA